jgi:hypothetical protein
VTPGSEGTVMTLELRLAPTLCLKNVDVEGDTDGLYERRRCPENTSNRRIICSITSWDRPWVDDTLYSEPACYQDARDGGTLETRHTDGNVREVSVVCLTMTVFAFLRKLDGSNCNRILVSCDKDNKPVICSATTEVIFLFDAVWLLIFCAQLMTV